MTHESEDDSDLEWRLHAMLDERAGDVDAQLSGPQLRAAAVRPRPAKNRVAPALATAAAVAAVGVGVALVTGHDTGHGSRPVQPGGGTGSNTVSSPRSAHPARPSGVTTAPPTQRPSPSVTPGRPPVSSTPPSSVVIGRPRVAATPTSDVQPRPIGSTAVPAIPSATPGSSTPITTTSGGRASR